MLGGELDDRLTVQTLREMLAGHPVTMLENAMKTHAEVDIAPWLSAIPEIVSLAERVESAHIEIGAGELSFKGIAENSLHYLEVMRKLEPICAEFGLQLINRLATLPS